MQPDVWLRPSLAVLDPALEDYESPLYRDGSLLTFSCGYRWEPGGPILAGVQAGPASGYRVSWLVAG